MNILLSGLGGHMGAEVVKLAEKNFRGACIKAGVDPMGAAYADIPCAKSFDEADKDVDIVVDFSHHTSTEALLDFCVKNNLPLVLATTGQTEEELEMIHKASESIPLFFATNYSVGVALLIELAKKTAAVFPEADIEIVETHHNRKVDAPSGTAITIAEEIASVRENPHIVSGRTGYGKREEGDIGIQSVRRGNIAGIHEVFVTTENQTISLKHETHNRALFAEGALAAAEFMIGKPAGHYDMKSMLTF